MKKEGASLGASSFATFFWIDQDLMELDQQCNWARGSIDAVKKTQMALMEAMGEVMRRIKVLEDNCMSGPLST